MSTSTNDLDLCYLSAGEAIAGFKGKTLSPVEVLEAQIARIEAVNLARTTWSENIWRVGDEIYPTAIVRGRESKCWPLHSSLSVH